MVLFKILTLRNLFKDIPERLNVGIITVKGIEIKKSYPTQVSWSFTTSEQAKSRVRKVILMSSFYHISDTPFLS